MNKNDDDRLTFTRGLIWIWGPIKPYKALSSTMQVLYLLVEQKEKEEIAM